MTDKAGVLSQIETLFHAAAVLPPQERESLLLGVAEHIAVRVRDLLDADAALDVTEYRSAPAMQTLESGTDTLQNTKAGRYRLIRPIGSGGMGIVYLAEREDSTHSDAIRHVAAVKFLHGALSTGSAVTSFLQERDTLASFSHAGIARLLDAGTTAGGHPFVAMEYVDGSSMDVFADSADTTAADLLPVLEQLCEAVIEAHRNLVLHRDIKPANVLVTAEKQAKLLDFGTRQLLDRTGAAAPTGAPQALTLRYASPEQLDGRVLSTSSDIYSLGLTLYRVLGGSLPPLLQGNNLAAYLLQSLTHRVPSPLHRTQIERWGISDRLARDLNAIVLRAIRYEPDERYSSVAALLDDLRASRLGERVRARGDTLTYRSHLFVRKHRADVATAVAAVLLLLTGLGLSLRQERRAVTLSKRTEAGVRAEQQLAHFLLFDYFDQLRDQPGSIPAQRFAASEALRSLEELERHSSDAALRIDAVEGYTRLGKLLGSPYEQDLGEVSAAIATLRHAVQLSQQMREAGNDTPAAREAEGAARTGLSQVLIGEGKYEEVPGWMTPAVQTARAVAADTGSTAPSLLRAAVTLNTYGDLYGQESDMSLHDGPRSIAIFKEAEAAYAKGVQRDAGCTACRSGMAVESWKLGMLNRGTDSEVAASYYRRALDAIEALPPAELSRSLARRRHIFIRQRLAEAERYLGHLSFALQLDEAARADCRDVIAHSPQDLQARRDLTDIAGQLSTMYLEAHRSREAVETAREYVATEDEMARLSPHSTMWQHLRFDAEDTLSQALLAAGDTAGAEAMQARAVADAERFAEAPTATSSVLNLAAIVLSRAHVHPEKAVLYAERNMKDNTDPAGEELLELARAEIDAGNHAKGAAAVSAALQFFVEHPRSPNAAASKREVLHLQNAASGPHSRTGVPSGRGR